MRSYDVAFEASGHDHSDWVGQVPWYDGSGNLLALNTTSCAIPVGPATLISDAAEEYAGFRMLSIGNGKLVGWGLAGANDAFRGRNLQG